eukprot:6190551-Pleurochrysis_carterae.AAC.1
MRCTLLLVATLFAAVGASECTEPDVTRSINAAAFAATESGQLRLVLNASDFVIPAVAAASFCQEGESYDGASLGAVLHFNELPPGSFLSLSTCDPESSLDTDLAVYSGGACGLDQLLACSGDAPTDKERCQLGYSQLEVFIESDTLKVVVGGFNGAADQVCGFVETSCAAGAPVAAFT